MWRNQHIAKARIAGQAHTVSQEVQNYRDVSTEVPLLTFLYKLTLCNGWPLHNGHVVILIDENDFHVGIAHMVGHTLIGEEVKGIVVHHLRAQRDGQPNANVFCFSLDRGRGDDEILGISSHQVNLEHALQAHVPLLCVILFL